MDVSEYDGRTIELVRLHESVKDLRVVGVDGSASNVDVAVVHGVKSDVLLTLVSSLGITLGVRNTVENEHVDVAAGGNDMVNTPHTGIVSPSIATDDPTTLEGECAKRAT